MKSKTNRIVGGLIIAFGALILLDNIFGGFDFWDFIWKLWPIALIVLGVYIIGKQRKIRGDIESGDFTSEYRIFGDLDVSFRGKEIANHHLSALVGDMRIDLTGANIKAGENKISASSLIGDIRILIPENIPVKLSSWSVIGDIRFDDLRRDGFFQKLDQMDDNFGSSEKKLLLTVNGIIGDVNVNRIRIDDVN
ncbi:MAG: cell wall-active antibiotics response protein [Candidatus Zixiibacteriota bacterium]|nr:MAG: cell wall-active antibiotics response protein [candidate division Zixibacteria bacterium]